MKTSLKRLISVFLAATMMLGCFAFTPGALAAGYDDSLIAHFPLRGDAADASGNGHTLDTRSGTWVDDSLYLAGGARSTNNYAQFEDDLLKDMDSVTVSMWIKNNSSMGNLTAFFFGSAAGTGGSNMPKDYILLVPCNPSGVYKTKIVNSDVTSNPYNAEVGYEGTDTTQYFGQWTHYAMVISPTQIIAYINGRRLGAASHTRQISDYAGTLSAYLGASNYTSDSLFSGYFRDVRFYSSALSDAQMDDLYLRDAGDYLTIESAYFHGDVLLESFAGYPISWEADDGVSVVDGKIVAGKELKQVTLTATYGNYVKRFLVTIFPKDPSLTPTVYAYVDARQSSAVGYSMHFAVVVDNEVTPLNFGDGILYAPADWTTQFSTQSQANIQDYDPTLSEYTWGGKRSLNNPWVFRMADGKFGVVAEQRAYDDTLPDGYDRTLFFWTTENLLDYEFKGAISPGATGAISKPQAEYDGGVYYLTWESGTEIHEVCTTDFVTFTDYTAASTRTRAIVPGVIDGVSCAFEVELDEYEYLLKKVMPLTNVAADNEAQITVGKGGELTIGDLPQTFKAYYSDTSEADMPIKWDDDVLASVNTDVPGKYTITGTAAYDRYEYPWITERADPCIKYYEGYYYFIATFDTGGSGANAYQQSIRIRRSTTLEGLQDAPESIILPNTYAQSSLKWAPELHIIGGRLSILLAIGQGGSAAWNRQHANIMTLKDGGDPLNADDWNEPVTIKRPGGEKQLQTNQNGISIDMTYFEVDGVHYYIWNQRFVRGTGTADLYIAQFDPENPSVLTTEPKCLLRPTYGWERPGDSRVSEGPFPLWHDGRLFITYSGGAVDSTYCVALMEADLGKDLTDPASWKVTGYPLLTTNKVTGQIGPGHNAYTTDEFGRDVNVFHARTGSGGGSTPRDSGMRTVHWAFDGTPVLYMTADRQLKEEYRTFTLTVKVAADPNLEADAEALAIPNVDDVRGNIYLPDMGANGSSITWTSSDPSVITTTGEVTRPAYGEDDIEVKLTAAISNDEDTLIREFDATVKSKPRNAPYSGYLLAYFLANTVSGENIRMSVSNGNSPMAWTRILKDGNDILFTSLLGEMGLRDPFIIRAPEGDRFYMIATDLSIGRNGNWTRAQTHGSLYLEIWESTDLITWSEQRHVKVSPDTAGNTWAPEAYWDDSIGAFVVFWASCLYPEGSERERSTPNRMMYCTTRDFVTFSEPQVWQDRDIATIDTTVIKHNGMYYRLTKNESGYNSSTNPYGKDMFLEKGVSLLDTNLDNWELIGENISRRVWNNGTGSTGYEGPVIFKANPGDPMGEGFYYMPDNNGGAGYRIAFIKDLDDISSFSSSAQMGTVDWGGAPSAIHHGTVANITEAERRALLGEEYKVPTTTSLTISGGAVSVGQNVTLTAQVTASDGGEVAGTIEFSAGSWSRTAKLVNGKAVLEVSSGLPLGSYEITARYLGFGEVDASEDTAAITVDAPAFVMAYTRPVGTSGSSIENMGFYDNSLHLAYSEDGSTWTALNDNKGMLFYKVSASRTSASSKQFRDPFIFQKPDGTYVLLATAVRYNNTVSDTSIIYWDSKDLISWENQKLITLSSGTVYPTAPQAVYNEAGGGYTIIWKQSGSETLYYNTIDSSFETPSEHAVYTGGNYNPAKLPDGVNVSDAPAGAIVGSVVPVTGEIVEKLNASLGTPRIPVGSEAITVETVAGTAPSLPQKGNIVYSDGTTEERSIIWEDGAADPESYSEPGVYEVTGRLEGTPDYINPLIKNGADPDIFKGPDGKYYFTASYMDYEQNGVASAQYDRIAIRCADTVQGLATAEERVVFWRRTGGVPMSYHIWAPEIRYVQFAGEAEGKWVIYFAGGRSNAAFDLKCYGMVCDSQDPMTGNWLEPVEMAGYRTSGNTFDLDMTVFEHRGEWYAIWASKPNTSNLVISKMIDATTLADPVGGTATICVPEYPWENRQDRVTEAATIMKANGKLYLGYAAGSTDATYCLGMMYADEDADILDPASWTKIPYPLMISNPETQQFGPGHATFTVAEDGVTPLLSYYARPFEGYSSMGYSPLYDATRYARIAVIYFHEDGTPYYGIPPADGYLPGSTVTATVNVAGYTAPPVGSSDNGDGTYTNPFVFADVPDLDIIRVGDAYWMSSTTMHMSPGVPIMKSYDLVNWETVSYCYLAMEDTNNAKLNGTSQMYSNGTWASALRYKDGKFYLVVPSATSNKTYIFQNTDPENKPWDRYEINTRYHDCGLLLDDDGRNWLVYNANPLYIIELNEDVTGVMPGATRRTILDNIHAPHPVTGVRPTSGLAEGAHIQKIGEKYFIFCITWPSGWPRTVVAWRADSLDGPWESKVVGMEGINYDGASSGTSGTYDGPAQGAIVDDEDGNWWGFVFRDSGPVGRSPWLMPITWTDGWPMFGQDEDGNGSYTNLQRSGAKPVQGMSFASVVTSDEFYNNTPKPAYIDSAKPTRVSYEDGEYDYNGSSLNMAWQWNHNPDNRYWSLTERPGWLRLNAKLNSAAATKTILNARNTLTQRVFGPVSAAVTSIDVSHMMDGDEAGLTLFAAKYGSIGVKMEGGVKYLVTTLSNNWTSGHANDRGVESARIQLTGDKVYLKAEGDFTVANVSATNPGDFYYSYDGVNWTKLGGTLNMIYSTGNHFMGYRFGLYNFAKTSEGGYVDFDFFRLYDRLTGESAPAVLGARMDNITIESDATAFDVPVMLDPLPSGQYAEITASFDIPSGVTVEEVVFGDGVTGAGSYELKENQLIMTVSGSSVDFRPDAMAAFATIKLSLDKPLSDPVAIILDNINVRGKGSEYVVYDVNGVAAVIQQISDNIVLSPLSKAFKPAVVGYTEAAAEVFTVTNPADTFKTVSISLSGDAFVLSASSLTIAAGGRETFTVTPRPGLAAGTYSGSVTVKDGELERTATFTFSVFETAGGIYVDSSFDAAELVPSGISATTSYITNGNALQALSGNVIQALYKGNRMEKAVFEPFIVAPGTSVIVKNVLTLPDELTDEHTLKCFVWDDKSAPLTSDITFSEVERTELPQPYVWYDFNQTGATEDGTVIPDMSGNGRDGRINSGTTGTAAWTGDALMLTNTASSSAGTGKWVNAPVGMMDGKDTFTLSLYAMQSVSNSGQYRFTFGIQQNPAGTPQNYFFFNNMGKYKAAITNSSNGGESAGGNIEVAAANMNVWEHYVIVLTPDTMTMYVDGTLIQTVPTTVKISDLGTNLNVDLGRSCWNADTLWAGSYGDFRIYDKAFSEQQVRELTRQIIQKTDPRLPQSLVDDWEALSLSKPSGSTLTGPLGVMPSTAPNGSAITWGATNPVYLSADGTVRRPSEEEGDQTAVLIATLTAPTGEKLTKAFIYTITAVSDAGDVAADAEALMIGSDPFVDGIDLNDFEMDAVLPTTGPGGNTTVEWATSDASVMSLDGKNHVTLGSKTVTLTATIRKGEAFATKEFILTCKPPVYGYLLAYFIGNSASQQQNFLALSPDGLNFTWLNGNTKIMEINEGEKAARDHFIIKHPYQETYYMLATDLDSNKSGTGTGWQERFGYPDTFTNSWGNKAIFVWKSEDLVSWTLASHTNFSGLDSEYEYTKGWGNSWAPEAIWVDDHDNGDGTTGAFMMFWSSSPQSLTSPSYSGYTDRNRIVCSFTKDFSEGSFSQTQELYFISDARADQIIDACIEWDPAIERWHMYFRRGANNTAHIERVTSVGKSVPSSTAEWTDRVTVPGALGTTTGSGFEGPDMNKVIGKQEWRMIADHFTSPEAFNIFSTTDFLNFTEITSPETNIGMSLAGIGSGGRVRHGAIIRISRERYEELAKLAEPGSWVY